MTLTLESQPQEPLARPQVAPLRIGPLAVDPPVLQAPMAGFTNFAYRQVVRSFGGVGLQATEMVHARGFLWIEQEQDDLPDRLWGVIDEPRPLAVQIWDNDPVTLAEVGAKYNLRKDGYSRGITGGSSGGPWFEGLNESTGNGGVAASARRSAAITSISISPVARFGLTLPSSRATTVPRAVTTCSERSVSASAWASAADSGWKTSWTMPERSRRSMKISPP